MNRRPRSNAELRRSNAELRERLHELLHQLHRAGEDRLADREVAHALLEAAIVAATHGKDDIPRPLADRAAKWWEKRTGAKKRDRVRQVWHAVLDAAGDLTPPETGPIEEQVYGGQKLILEGEVRCSSRP